VHFLLEHNISTFCVHWRIASQSHIIATCTDLHTVCICMTCKQSTTSTNRMSHRWGRRRSSLISAAIEPLCSSATPERKPQALEAAAAPDSASSCSSTSTTLTAATAATSVHSCASCGATVAAAAVGAVTAAAAPLQLTAVDSSSMSISTAASSSGLFSSKVAAAAVAAAASPSSKRSSFSAVALLRRDSAWHAA
jgi:ribosomal protein L37AE/L43A